MYRIIIFLFSFLFCLPAQSQSYQIKLSTEQTYALGQLIWKNEGQQKQQHLTTWNRGEDFPSLGLGHFIWYPHQQKGPFKEQFPALLVFFQENGLQLPAWLNDIDLAPWKSREQFYSEFDGEQLSSLREFLSEHITLQTQFIMQRLETAIPEIIADCDAQQREVVTTHLSVLTATVKGMFALLDYINFKGEGLSMKERYQGQGWGLKQVLLAMPKAYDNPLRAFGLAADEILTRRVKNASRDEFRWLKGWRARVHAYQYMTINK